MIKISEILEIGSNKKYIDNLIKECKKENIIPFIGAGMSVPIYELWGDFLIDVSKKSFDSEFPKKIWKRIEAGEYECAASDVLEELGEGEFYSALTDAFSKEKIKTVKNMAVNLLPDIFHGFVITTNLGLYPKPHNWYSNLIKTYQEKGSDRYIHYLKDDEALRFISIARSLNEQNRDIHNWFASEIFGDIKPIQQKTYHHYGMPTDYSIAIGTYVVDERDVVPIFSREGYPIFLFRPSSNMWSIVLEGKTKYIIPHGWGQELRYDYFAKQIQKEDFKNGKLSIKNGKFVLSNSQHGYYEKKFDIDYSARFNKKQVGVRDLYKTDKFDGKNIFGDTPYIKGTIEEILDPVALFSSDTEGAVKYYVSGEEN